MNILMSQLKNKILQTVKTVAVEIEGSEKKEDTFIVLIICQIIGSSLAKIIISILFIKKLCDLGHFQKSLMMLSHHALMLG